MSRVGEEAMDPGRRERIEAVFEAALDVEPSARAAFLTQACGDDGLLLSAVRALLRAHVRAEGPLERKLPAPPAAMLLPPTAPGGASSGDLGLGVERVGPYRILDVLGRGGMGVVYLAERDDGHFRRRVAIKLMRHDAGPMLLERMLAERQILASLDHPDIARLLDGGVTPDGRPYLVMEHVAGLPIDVYCDRMRLSVPARLRLFARVARAVEHAHRNLIVHRDLKPSNILVTTDGRVKLLDFGIAKLLNPALSGVESPVTRSESRPLTPEYASPEQLRGEALTTASDVYSLGVVLYRLLTGCAPYDFGERGLAAILATVLEKEPNRPSARATAEPPATTPATRASDRATTPDRLRRALRGDLDAIVLKTLRTEPAHRYGSAEQLAQDIERFLAGEPVLAHQGSRWYRARKLLRRHRVGAMAASVVAASLLLGAGAAAWQARVAGRERDRARAASAVADRSARQSEAVADFLIGLFESGDPESGSGDVTARDLLARGVERTDALDGQPLVKARLLDVVGRMYLGLGEFGEAERMIERAVAGWQTQLGDSAPELAQSLLGLARVQRSEGRIEDARRLALRAVAIQRAAHGAGHPAVAAALAELGWVSPLEEQEHLYRQAYEIYRAADAEPAQRVELLHGLATNLRRQGRFDESEASDREALELARARFGPDAAETAYAMIHLADLVRDFRQDYAGAERLFRRGLELQTRYYGPNSLRLIHGLHSLAWLRSRLGDHAEAEALYRRAYALRLAAAGPDHPAVAGEMATLSAELARQGRFDEAEALARDALALTERRLGVGHVRTAAYFSAIASILAQRGRYTAADSLYERSGVVLTANGEGHSVAMAEFQRERGRMLIRAGRYEGAEAALLESLSLMKEWYRDDHPNLVDSRRALFELYTAWGRPAEAEKYRVPPGEFIAY